MHVKTIGVSYERKFNLGDYESVQCSISLYADLEPDENYQSAVLMLTEDAKTAVKETLINLLKENEHQIKKVTVRKQFAGKPIEE
jgi:hypothetical protein